MPAGLTSQFNILERSPHDIEPVPAPASSSQASRRLVPSRYNVRAMTKDGRMVLWNTFHGQMNVFPAKSVEQVRRLLRQAGYDGPFQGMARYLEQRGYLIEEGSDEYRQIELAFGQQHYRTDTLELILLASEDCNLRCEYCYEQFARGTMEPRVRQAVKALVRERAPRLKELAISWFGGEPLYGFDAIEELAPFFLEVSEEWGLHYWNNMTTNGYLLTPSVADRLLSWRIRHFQITLDGAFDDHNRNRPTREGGASFDQIYRNLQALSERDDDFWIDLRVNFDQKNHPGLERFLDLLEEDFSADSRFNLRFRAVGKWGGPNDDKLQVCGADESRRITERLKHEARKRGLALSDGLRGFRSFGSQVCYAARPYSFIIGANGQVMKCTIDLDLHDRNIVGLLTDDGKLELNQEKMSLWTEAAFQRDSKCQKCVVLPACQGVHCPQIRMDHDRSPCTPLRSSFKARLQEAAEDDRLPATAVTVRTQSKPEPKATALPGR